MKYISECSLSKLIFQIQYKELSPERLINNLCDKLDKWNPKIEAFLPEAGRRERLLKDLAELYQKFPDTDSRPILFGIPIGVKDIFQVDGFETKAGSLLHSDILRGKEAEVVTKLKQAGALIMGKTVTTEFAYFHPGPTTNPHNFDHTPGGSSSGSAAAVAAGFCPLTLGTQTIGSISRPAAFCGAIGFKPSFGRISTESVIPFSRSADHIGFFTQDLKGSEIIASILCDNWNDELPESDRNPILGIPEGRYLQQTSPEILSAFYSTIEKLQNEGIEIRSVPVFDNIVEINEMHKLMNAAEFAKVHEKWFSKYSSKYHQVSIDLIEKGRNISEQLLNSAIDGRIKLREEIAHLQLSNNINLWISPSTVTTAPLGLDSTGDPTMNLPWTFAGIPTLSIPFGYIDQLPFGIQFAGNFNKDEFLFRMLTKLI